MDEQREERNPSKILSQIKEIGKTLDRMNDKLRPVLLSEKIEEESKTPSSVEEKSELMFELDKLLNFARSIEQRIMV